MLSYPLRPVHPPLTSLRLFAPLTLCEGREIPRFARNDMGIARRNDMASPLLFLK